MTVWQDWMAVDGVWTRNWICLLQILTSSNCSQLLQFNTAHIKSSQFITAPTSCAWPQSSNESYSSCPYWSDAAARKSHLKTFKLVTTCLVEELSSGMFSQWYQLKMSFGFSQNWLLVWIMIFTTKLGNIFQQWIFLCSQTQSHRLVTASHQYLILLILSYQGDNAVPLIVLPGPRASSPRLLTATCLTDSTISRSLTLSCFSVCLCDIALDGADPT
jgi:hypothetical protein